MTAKGNCMSHQRMKQHLFYTFLAIFVATAAIALLGITGALAIPDFYLKSLTAALLIELVGAVIVMYKKVDFFAPDDPPHRQTTEHQEPALQSQTPVTPAPTASLPVIAAHVTQNLATTGPKEPVHATNFLSQFNDFESALSVSRKIPIGFENHLDSLRSFVNYLRDCESELPALEADKNIIFNRFVGIQIDWKATLSSIKKIDENNVYIFAIDDVWVLESGQIDVSKNPEVRLLRKGARIRIRGAISKLDYLDVVTLSNSTIELCPNDE